MHIINNIHIGSNLFTDSNLYTKYCKSSKVLLLVDDKVGDLYLPQILATLKTFDVKVIILSHGEKTKNWQSIEQVIQALIDHECDRNSTLISVGGGVIGDLGGMAAAIYMRGINWLQIPTTLLAQVDSSVGGKTGCNYQGIKNLLGTFYLPQAVITDIKVLDSLNAREYNAGLAEVVKYGMACDADFFTWLEQNRYAIKNREAKALQLMIARCVQIKSDIVALDMHDCDMRRVLNFGHTFAHALEAASGLQHYLHGEAVSLGMLLASRLAVNIGILHTDILDRLSDLLVYLGLPTELDNAICDHLELFSYMRFDKKRQGQKLQFILPCAIGKVIVTDEITLDNLEGVLKNYV